MVPLLFYCYHRDEVLDGASDRVTSGYSVGPLLQDMHESDQARCLVIPTIAQTSKIFHQTHTWTRAKLLHVTFACEFETRIPLVV